MALIELQRFHADLIRTDREVRIPPMVVVPRGKELLWTQASPRLAKLASGSKKILPKAPHLLGYVRNKG